MMNQSTIYRRHERRLARSYALKDDPRPAMIRVMSGLPILSLVFPPFEPKQQPSQRTHHPIEVNSATDCAIFHSMDESVTHPTQGPWKEDAITHVSQVSFAGSVGGFVAQWLFGKAERRPWMATGIKSNGSPFSHVSQVDGALSTTLTRPRAATLVGRVEFPWSRALAGAASTGLLFGTKSFVSSQLEARTEDISSPASLSFVVSSAMGGAAVATSFSLQPRAIAQTGTLYRWLSAAPSLYAREMMGAVLLFSSYETLKHVVGGEDPTTHGDFAVAVSGALAGVLYRAAASVIAPPSVPRSILPTLIRAAPAHAVLFCVYERVRKTTRQYSDKAKSYKNAAQRDQESTASST